MTNKIIINKQYYIERDNYNFTLYENITRVRKDTNEKYTDGSLVGYFSRLDSLLHYVLTHKLLTVEAKDIKTLIKKIDIIKKDIDKLCKISVTKICDDCKKQKK